MSSPNAAELAQQKFEAARALGDFHDGVWRGAAACWPVTSDPAADGTERFDADYETRVTVSVGTKGLEMTETGGADDDVRTRTLLLPDRDADADAVDGSYSLDFRGDDAWPVVPVIGFDASNARFGVEHCLATGDDERVRLFALYKKDDTLDRIVLCEETRVGGGGGGSIDKSDDDDMDRLVARITGETGATSSSSSNDRMDQLLKAMQEQKDDASSSDDNDDEGNVIVSRYPMTLYGLVSGVWLGDAVVRTHHRGKQTSKKVARRKGFGAATPVAPSSSTKPSEKALSDGFAEWDTGVQKIATVWSWDYGETILRRTDAGRSMGAGLSPDYPSATSGTLVRNDSGRRKRRLTADGGVPDLAALARERLAVVDIDSGSYVCIVTRSVAIEVPRVLPRRRGDDEDDDRMTRPFRTELSVFQKRVVREDGGGAASFVATDDETAAPEIFCTRSTRMYGTDGRLRQGVSLFFTLDRTKMTTTDKE